jgi:hypothetical protein
MVKSYKESPQYQNLESRCAAPIQARSDEFNVGEFDQF